jgi:CRISPR-associated protein Cas1
MIKRIIEVSSSSYLHLSRQQLVIEQDGNKIGCVPIEDLGILIIANPGNVLTQQLLASCADNLVVVVLCGLDYLPKSLLLPLFGHSVHAAILRQQIAARKVIINRVWQQLVRAKLAAQASVITINGGKPVYLERLIEKVKTGDPENCEAQGARYYWQELFGKSFRRDPDMDGINSLLNYGYAIVRACLARAVVGAGFHPALGLFHSNQYNDFALVDDLIEPLRPLVDMRVLVLSRNNPRITLDREVRAALLELTAAECIINGRPLPLMVALQEYVASLRRVFVGEVAKLEVPECKFSEAIAPCGLS